MFTGIIEATAKIGRRRLSGKSGTLSILLVEALKNPVKGESISVNGACLSLEGVSGEGRILSFHVLKETLDRTNLGTLPLDSKVNIERSLSFGDRIGGHFVTGHVDAALPVKKWSEVGGDWELSVCVPPELAPFIVEKGSVAIDGVSLTVVSVEKTFFTVHLIPLTRTSTALMDRDAGDLVNIETDILGKYVQKSLIARNDTKKSGISFRLLEESGWEL